MLFFLGLLWKLVSGNLSGIVSDIASSSNAKYSAEGTVDVASIQAAASNYQTRAKMLSSMKITQYLIAAALLPPIYHMGGVFLDSCPFFGIPYWAHQVGSWKFIALPKPYDTYEWSLVASLLGIQTGLAVGINLIGSLFKDI